MEQKKEKRLRIRSCLTGAIWLALVLEILDKEYIDLIISVIMMPVMDGYELVSELRSAGYQICSA